MKPSGTGICLAFFSSFLFMAAVILIMVGAFALNDNWYYYGNLSDYTNVGAQFVGRDIHHAGPFRWCDDYRLKPNVDLGLRCSNIDMNCMFTLTTLTGVENSVQLPNCNQFNAYRGTLILLMVLAFMCFFFSFFSCCTTARVPKLFVVTLGVIAMFTGVIMTATLVDYKLNRFDPFHSGFIFNPQGTGQLVVNAPPPNVGTSLYLQIFGWVLFVLGTFVHAAMLCQCVNYVRGKPMTVISEFYTNYYTKNPAIQLHDNPSSVGTV